MAVTILGNSLTDSTTILGGPVTVNTGIAVTTLPVASPVTLVNTGANADSWWDLSTLTLYPENLAYKVGLGTVDNGTVADHVLMLGVNNEVKKVNGSTFSAAAHTHAFADLTSKPTTIAAIGLTDTFTKIEVIAGYQPLDADLTSIAGLGYASTSFLKKTAANTWVLDTNAYSTTAHLHAGTYESVLGNPAVDDFVLSSKTNGTRSWVARGTISGGGGGVTDHGLLDSPSLSDDDHAQYAYLAGRGTGDTLKIDHINEDITNHGVLIEGVLLKDGDVIAFYSA